MLSLASFAASLAVFLRHQGQYLKADTYIFLDLPTDSGDDEGGMISRLSSSCIFFFFWDGEGDTKTPDVETAHWAWFGSLRLWESVGLSETDG